MVQALSHVGNSSSIRLGEHRFSDKVITAGGISLSRGTTFKLGICNFFDESIQFTLFPLKTPHRKNNIFQPANNRTNFSRYVILRQNKTITVMYKCTVRSIVMKRAERKMISPPGLV